MELNSCNTKPVIHDGNVEQYVKQLGQRAKLSSIELARSETRLRNEVLFAMASSFRRNSSTLLDANDQDVAQAVAEGLGDVMLNRLRITSKTIEAMACGFEKIAQLADPIGEISELNNLPSGLMVGKMRVPLGVLGMIYEARPNVTADAAALCIKSGNSVILKGGKESLRSNREIELLIRSALEKSGLSPNVIQLIETTDRAAVKTLISMTEYVDVIIPRGGRGLIEHITAEAKVPVLKHLDGNCHIYVDRSADFGMAEIIIENAKTQKYSPCNTAESLLVARDISANLLPIVGAMLARNGVEMRCCTESFSIISKAEILGAKIVEANEDDWYAEYLAPVISIKIVQDTVEAIEHINQYSSHHTDAIITNSHYEAKRFAREVDSSSVMINASTRFADGFEYGLGGEIGISTGKLHARGPVGLEGLTSQKWLVIGNGQIRV